MLRLRKPHEVLKKQVSTIFDIISLKEGEIMDITKKSVDELKSLAYDQMVELQRIQQNLQLINNEIAKRAEVKEEKK